MLLVQSMSLTLFRAKWSPQKEKKTKIYTSPPPKCLKICYIILDFLVFYRSVINVLQTSMKCYFVKERLLIKTRTRSTTDRCITIWTSERTLTSITMSFKSYLKFYKSKRLTKVNMFFSVVNLLGLSEHYDWVSECW